MGQMSAGFMIVCVLLSMPYDERKIEKAFTCVIIKDCYLYSFAV